MIEDNRKRLAREYFWFALALIVILMSSAAHAAAFKLKQPPPPLSKRLDFIVVDFRPIPSLR